QYQYEGTGKTDRIALQRSGELEQVATPREIYSHPATAYTAQFIGHTNLLRAEVKKGVARFGSISWPVQVPDGRVLFSLRPEKIRLAGASGATTCDAVLFWGPGVPIDSVFADGLL